VCDFTGISIRLEWLFSPLSIINQGIFLMNVLVNAIISLSSLLIYIFLTGCETEPKMTRISQITYSSDAGTILPELQWHEEYQITPEEITFKRNGKALDTMVNEGSWSMDVDEDVLKNLFDQINGVNLSSLERIEPTDIPEGGGSESIQIKLDNGKEFDFSFTPGVRYTNEELILKPLEEFIQNLSLPLEAVNRLLIL